MKRFHKGLALQEGYTNAKEYSVLQRGKRQFDMDTAQIATGKVGGRRPGLRKLPRGRKSASLVWRPRLGAGQPVSVLHRKGELLSTWMGVGSVGTQPSAQTDSAGTKPRARPLPEKLQATPRTSALECFSLLNSRETAACPVLLLSGLEADSGLQILSLEFLN